MTLYRGLLTTARRLARANPSKPRQSDLRRAVSTAYYAVFHALAHECADRFIGTSSSRSIDAWTQVYRALGHGQAKNACRQEVEPLGFPPGLLQFANTFVLLQEERHVADYDPGRTYTRAEVVALVANADQAIHDLRHAPKPDRAALAALVLLPRRR